MKNDSDFDPFQEAWNGPVKFHAIYVDEKNGFMVIPDAMPVVEHHILIISREATPYQELPTHRQLQMMALANIVADHMNRVLKPERKIGYAIWGNTIKTAHIHLVPRNVPEDGIKFFDGNRPNATDEQLETTRKLLQFSDNLRLHVAKKVKEIATSLEN